jgi:triosephosphate isomerase
MSLSGLIGTGLTATPEQAQEMHKFIRGLVSKKYGKKLRKILQYNTGEAANLQMLPRYSQT